ncbi:MAG: hypothetical protein K0B08_01410 [Bacteroidales bacterium]|nr:hypothetical protein [Bacteroidales bacterium]
MTRNLLMGVLAASMIIVFTECSRKVYFLSSSVVPAASGYVEVKKNRNKNYVIEVNVSNLAEASMLTPPKQTYVVWMVTDRDQTKNIGQIRSSSRLNASLETTSSFKPVKIFLTAENDPTSNWPGEPVVLTTGNFWD